MNTIARDFGIAPDDVETFHEWVNDPADGSARINRYLGGIIEERRNHPDDSDVIGLLAKSVVENESERHTRTDGEILGFANLGSPPAPAPPTAHRPPREQSEPLAAAYFLATLDELATEIRTAGLAVWISPITPSGTPTRPAVFVPHC